MKTTLKFLLFQLPLLWAIHAYAIIYPTAGFSIPDSLREVTFKYRSVKNLIVLPVTINDTVHVNLILDTGCRNLVLFGKRFTRLFPLHPSREIQFSGLGDGKPVVGGLSLGNKVSINAVLGEKIPVVVVPDQNLFESYKQVDGVIGYDIFIKFEVELNMARQIITFRPANIAEVSSGYEKIPIRVEDSRPIINSMIFFQGKDGQTCDLMLDTGSSLGLLLKTGDLRKYPQDGQLSVLGRGFNGDLQGTEALAEKLLLAHYELKRLPAGIVYSPWHNYASVGMEIMKDYSIVLNYCKAYVGFKKA
jgi:Aspartyl protease